MGAVLNSLPLLKNLFPPPQEADEAGVIAVGGPLNVPVLVTAYYNGIFPWPHAGLPLLWFCPKQRGVLFFKDLHLGRSLKRSISRAQLRFTWNRAFREVMRHCSQVPRRGDAGTWITPEMEEGYLLLHKAGFAHSLEAWDGDKLVGGIYGVFVAGVFSGESMFGLQTDVSKICLIQLLNFLSRLGLTWMDIQMVTSVTKYLGGKEISRDDFLTLLRESHVQFFDKKMIAPEDASF